MHNPRFKDLHAWQNAMLLTKSVYLITEKFPKSEQFGLTDQIKRSAVSVPSNIAEGYGRGTIKDLLHFLYIARGSLFELDTQLDIAVDVGIIEKEYLITTKDYLTATNITLSKLISYHKQNSKS